MAQLFVLHGNKLVPAEADSEDRVFVVDDNDHDEEQFVFHHAYDVSDPKNVMMYGFDNDGNIVPIHDATTPDDLLDALVRHEGIEEDGDPDGDTIVDPPQQPPRAPTTEMDTTDQLDSFKKNNYFAVDPDDEGRAIEIQFGNGKDGVFLDVDGGQHQEVYRVSSEGARVVFYNDDGNLTELPPEFLPECIRVLILCLEPEEEDPEIPSGQQQTMIEDGGEGSSAIYIPVSNFYTHPLYVEQGNGLIPVISVETGYGDFILPDGSEHYRAWDIEGLLPEAVSFDTDAQEVVRITPDPSTPPWIQSAMKEIKKRREQEETNLAVDIPDHVRRAHQHASTPLGLTDDMDTPLQFDSSAQPEPSSEQVAEESGPAQHTTTPGPQYYTTDFNPVLVTAFGIINDNTGVALEDGAHIQDREGNSFVIENGAIRPIIKTDRPYLEHAEADEEPPDEEAEEDAPRVVTEPIRPPRQELLPYRVTPPDEEESRTFAENTFYMASGFIKLVLILALLLCWIYIGLAEYYGHANVINQTLGREVKPAQSDDQSR